MRCFRLISQSTWPSLSSATRATVFDWYLTMGRAFLIQRFGRAPWALLATGYSTVVH